MAHEYRENEMQMTDELEKIDIESFLMDMVRGVKRLWWLVIGLAAIFGAVSYFKVRTSYQSTYVASATMAVNFSGALSSYINMESAQQMAEVFPYILTSGVLEEVIAEDLGMDYVPASITATAESGINLFTLSVTANDAQTAYDVLQSVIRNYPEVARFVLGETSLTIMDETGIPEDTGKIYVIRGSVKEGMLKGALIGLTIMALYVLNRRTVKSRKELKKKINLEDYGSIPYVREKKRRKGKNAAQVSLLDERVPQVYLESIRKLRIKIMKEMEQNNYKTLMITSSVPGEGKSTVAVNLAIAIAKQGKKVILVDADPRNPSVAASMNANIQGTFVSCGDMNSGRSAIRHENICLGDILRKQVPLEEVLTDIPVENGDLKVLFGGEPRFQDAKLLGTRIMKKLLNGLSANADVVILDTAPSELLADAPALAKFVDAALYVVKYDHAKVRQIRAGIQALAMSGIDILGYTFNADQTSQQRGYGYTYEKYGYGRYRSYGSYGRYGGYLKSRDSNQDNAGRVYKD